MTRLAERDLRAALDIGLEAQAAESVKDLRDALLPALRDVVGCDLIGYNEVDLSNGTALGILDPPEGGFDGFEDNFRRVMHQHPLVSRQATGDLSVRTLSDFLTARQLHRLELYHDFYALVDAEDQLAFGLAGEAIVAIALCRPSRSFTDRDRELLERMRPHLALAYNNAREGERVGALIEALESGLERRHTALLQLDPSGRIVHKIGAADELLDAYAGSDAREPHELPAALDKLRAGNGDGAPARTIAGTRGRLRVCARPAAPRGWRTLILEERRASPPSIESLRTMGLSDRQAQVLRLLACGKQSKQIAAELRISTGTVRKHVEHIYDALAVNSRAQALAQVHGMGSAPLAD